MALKNGFPKDLTCELGLEGERQLEGRQVGQREEVVHIDLEDLSLSPAKNTLKDFSLHGPVASGG